MKIIDGIAYAKKDVDELKVRTAKPLADMILILTFNTGEEKIFDATVLLDMPAFQPLKDEEIFKTCKVVDGVVTWDDGDIDIGTEKLYSLSFKYDRLEIS